jgi:hypothetical protein
MISNPMAIPIDNAILVMNAATFACAGYDSLRLRKSGMALDTSDT